MRVNGVLLKLVFVGFCRIIQEQSKTGDCRSQILELARQWLRTEAMLPPAEAATTLVAVAFLQDLNTSQVRSHSPFTFGVSVVARSASLEKTLSTW